MEQHPLSWLGWDDTLAAAFTEFSVAGLEPGRVTAVHRGVAVVQTMQGEERAEPSGRLRFDAEAGRDMPVVGDWVALRRPGPGAVVMDAIVPRRTRLSRKDPHGPKEQVVVANVDVVCCVEAAAGGVNHRSLQRYVTMAWESGAEPLVVLTKTDLCRDQEEALAAAQRAALAAPVLMTSAISGDGIDQLHAHLSEAGTAVLVGPSGVGKSSLVNRLCGEDRQAVREIRDDGRGRHTTTHRELILLPGGGLLIDTPGLRELALWDADEGLDAAFADVVDVAAGCRFSDCDHGAEPGCEVRAAIDEGRLARDRLDGFRKLQRELAFLERRQDPVAQKEERQRWKKITKAHRKSKKS